MRHGQKRKLSIALLVVALAFIATGCDVVMPWDHKRLVGQYSLLEIEGGYSLEYGGSKVLLAGQQVRLIGWDKRYLACQTDTDPQIKLFDLQSSGSSPMPANEAELLLRKRGITMHSPKHAIEHHD